jgi:uncharacterized membrane protein
MIPPVPVPQPTPCGATSCPLWVSLKEHFDKQYEASEKAIELARKGLEYRFEKILSDQLRQYPDRIAHDKLETRLAKLEESAALTTGKLAAVVAVITLGLATIFSLLHILQRG